MKRVLTILALILTFCMGALAGGIASAGEGFKVFINGKELQSNPPPLMYQGRIYVPLRAVSEYMGADANWDAPYNTAYIASQRDALSEIEIEGPSDFREMMIKSLEILRDRAPDDYKFVGKYVRKIMVDDNALKAFINVDTMTIHMERDYGMDEYWWAAEIVHEAQHAEQRYNVKNLSIEEAEMEAGRRDLETLRRIGAPQKYIDFAEKQMKTGWWDSPLTK